MSQRRLHFTLTADEAETLVHLVGGLEELGLKSRTATRAIDKLDEQMAQQNRTWERCPKCNGSGWVEGLAGTKRAEGQA